MAVNPTKAGDWLWYTLVLVPAPSAGCCTPPGSQLAGSAQRSKAVPVQQSVLLPPLTLPPVPLVSAFLG